MVRKRNSRYLRSMLQVSLHNIKLHAPVGLYAEEKVTGNNFETDVDLRLETTAAGSWPFIDYTIINTIVTEAFAPGADLLEEVIQRILVALKQSFPDCKARVAIRKLRPPLPGEVGYSQVSFEE